MSHNVSLCHINDDAVAHDDTAGNNGIAPGGPAAEASEMPTTSAAYEAAEGEAKEFHAAAVGEMMSHVEVADVLCHVGGMVAPEEEEIVAAHHGGAVYQADDRDVEASDVAAEEMNVVHVGEAQVAFKEEELSESQAVSLNPHAPNEAVAPLDESSTGRDLVYPEASPPSKKAKLELTEQHDGVVIPELPPLQDGHVQGESFQHVADTSDTEGIATHETSSHRKSRKEFTASEKLAILSELDAPNPPSIKDLLAKYGLSKSSFHRWRTPQVKERLLEMAKSGEELDVGFPIREESNGDKAPAISTQQGELVQVPPPSLLYKGNKKRDMSDGLLPLKRSLQEFIEFNASLPPEEQFAIRSAFLQVKARELRNELMRQAEEREAEIEMWKIQQEQRKQNHIEPPNDENDGITNENENDSNPCPLPLLTPTELKSLQNFKGSKSWSCQIASQLGFLTASWSEASEANSRKYLEEAATASSGALVGAVDVKKPKKTRMEFTASDKVRILKEIDESNIRRKNEGVPIWTVEEICERYGTSKSSLHRWRQQHKSGQLDAALEEGSTDVKRIFKDKLSVVKGALAEFVAGQSKVEYFMLQQRALEVRDELLKAYEENLKSGTMEGVDAEAPAAVGEGAVVAKDINVREEEDSAAVATDQDVSLLIGDTAVASTTQDDGAVSGSQDSHIDKEHTSTAETNALSLAASKLTEDEYQALRSFKASMSWLREVAKKYNWTMVSNDTKLAEDWRVVGRRALYERRYYHDHHHRIEGEETQEQEYHEVSEKVETREHEYHGLSEKEETQEQEYHDEAPNAVIVTEVAQEQLPDEHADEELSQARHHHEVHYDLVMAEVEQPSVEDYELQVAEILEGSKIRGAIDTDVSL
ncbi:hypothetical protein HJC23_010835 [Cyclotella cryptica]|uniref:Uncharacterized protein n=1 Tax=Cyclotella cryptica TaxID=29204 RepID=A0ABD3QPZ1_9STRA|eukprot:CCRYP_003589-RA/>CCRYP_003589-RA protein AED:0.18 eAED:0.18 QI:0/-1/0/1/-1/1/1/0/875